MVDILNSAPMTAWEGVAAYFTYADQPLMIQFWFWLAVILCVLPILSSIGHEIRVERRHRRR